MTDETRTTTDVTEPGPKSPAEVELARITYKPGWVFRWGRGHDGTASGHWDYPQLTITVPFVSIDRPDATLHFCFPVYAPPERLTDTVWAAVQWIENHEQREHFQVDGERYIDPHPAKEERAMFETRQATLGALGEEREGWRSTRCQTCGGWRPGTPDRLRTDG